jgi:type II secretory pathway pseudopilin PulG
MSTTARSDRSARGEAGYSLVELLVALGVFTVVMGTVMTGLGEATKTNDAVLQLSGMNNALRISMDLMVRDMLQVGSGLPPGHTVTIPSGAGATPVRIPGPPGTNFTLDVTAGSMPAVLPRPGAGPTINGVVTDVVSVLFADNTFLDAGITAIDGTGVTVAPGIDIANAPDRVSAGQLMMVSKGSFTTLVQVTDVDTATRRLTFAQGDSLNLNQPGAEFGSLAALNAEAPANSPASTWISRVRMITYYLDTVTDPLHPRLVRRVNNGHPTTFDNDLGTAVAFDIENLQVTYDLSDGTVNPSNVKMTATDLTTSGACSPNVCSPVQIRKMNIALAGRSTNATNVHARIFRNTLASQVSLRGMAFVDRYQAP